MTLPPYSNHSRSTREAGHWDCGHWDCLVQLSIRRPLKETSEAQVIV